ncbi:hypothetical protein FACUT_756 [Fusarium acutatum]|uniref:Uncharacterized protein n=1 Tax=Fusarium acutatum TaxID=78861 RepID=A0A8H4K7P2_9HYPO|nr:hypothetical protein FACUT_756 [Fusarium acutatum]
MESPSEASSSSCDDASSGSSPEQEMYPDQPEYTLFEVIVGVTPQTFHCIRLYFHRLWQIEEPISLRFQHTQIVTFDDSVIPVNGLSQDLDKKGFYPDDDPDFNDQGKSNLPRGRDNRGSGQRRERRSVTSNWKEAIMAMATAQNSNVACEPPEFTQLLPTPGPSLPPTNTHLSIAIPSTLSPHHLPATFNNHQHLRHHKHTALFHPLSAHLPDVNMADLIDPGTTKLVFIVSLLWIISFTLHNLYEINDIIFYSIAIGTSFVVAAASCVCISGLAVIAVYFSVLANAAILCIIVMLFPVLQYLIQSISSIFTRVKNACDRVIGFFDAVAVFLDNISTAVQLFPPSFYRFLYGPDGLEPLTDE